MTDNDEIGATTPDVALTAPAARARRRRILAILAFPLLVVVAASVLSALNLNGSSVALLSPEHRNDPRIVAGTPRGIRSDEFVIASPIQVGNVQKSFPAQTWIGLTDTDLDATSLGAPVASWFAVVQPTTWPTFVLGAERGFATRWWLSLVLCLVGVYFLLYTLRPRPALAATLATAVGLSPLTAW